MISTYISKDDSNAIKGIAILFMLFFHLFNRITDGVVDFWIQEQPLTKFLSSATYPVPFFLMMSGYGFYYTYKNGNLTFTSNIKRALKLYLHYWVVMLIFVSIGIFVAPWHYPDTFSAFLSNVTGLHCTYNYETWFLLPYVVLSFFSPYIFKGMDRIGILLSLFIAFLVSFGARFCISRYVATGLISNTFVGFSLSTLGLLLDYVIGACMMNCGNLTKNEQGRQIPIWLSLILLVVLISFRCMIRLPWSSLYAFLLVFLFLNTRRTVWGDRFLAELGKKSMVMWMVHTYFSIYLFHDFIYGFKYPLIIYVVLVIVSYFTSSLLMKLTNPLVKIVISNK